MRQASAPPLMKGFYMTNALRMFNPSIMAAVDAHMLTETTVSNIFIAVEVMAARHKVSSKSVYRELEMLYPRLYADSFTWRF